MGKAVLLLCQLRSFSDHDSASTTNADNDHSLNRAPDTALVKVFFEPGHATRDRSILLRLILPLPVV